MDHLARRRDLPDLRVPLRDAIRGAGVIADLVGRTLEPASHTLPEGLRTRIDHGLRLSRRFGHRLVRVPLDTERLRAAGRFVSGKDTRDAGACAAVVAVAWAQLQGESGAVRYPLNETLLTELFRRRARVRTGAGPDFAIHFLLDLRQCVTPGSRPGASAPAVREVDTVILAIVLWLLAERPTTVAADLRLLDLARAYVSAAGWAETSAFLDPGPFRMTLSDAAAHL